MAKVEQLMAIKKEIEIEEQGIEDAVEMPDPVSNVVDDGNSKVIDMSEGAVPPSTSVRDGFNGNQTQNALHDNDVEGGLQAYRSTSGSMGGSGLQGNQSSGITIDTEGSIELSGFQAECDGRAFDVIAKYDSIEKAKASVNGVKFIFVEEGNLVVSDIVNGSPTISNDEQELAKYVNGEWGRP